MSWLKINTTKYDLYSKLNTAKDAIVKALYNKICHIMKANTMKDALIKGKYNKILTSGILQTTDFVFYNKFTQSLIASTSHENLIFYPIMDDNNVGFI